MLERKNIINEYSKKERYHTPDQFPPRIKQTIDQSIQNQNKSFKKILNTKNNYISNTSENTLERSSNIDQNNIDNIDLLNKKIISQQNDISYLKSRLENYDNSLNEISRLKQELSKMEVAIKYKNQIISEFQKLSEISKIKLQEFINKEEFKSKINNKKLESLPDIKKENNDLTQKLKLLQEENSKLRQMYEDIELKNKNEVNAIQNNVNSNKKNFEDILKKNSDIKSENNHNKIEIDKLKQKLLDQEKYELELEDINKKYKLLVNRMNEKNNSIQNLEKANQTIENKINLSNSKYKKILNEKSELKEKLAQLEELCNQYELTFRKMKFDENYNNIKTNITLFNNDKNYNFGFKAKNNYHKATLDAKDNKLNNFNYNDDYHYINNFKKKIHYHHNNNEKVIEDDNYDYIRNYKKYSNNLIGRKYDGNVYDNNYNLKYKLTTNRNTKRNNIDYIRQSNKLLDKSFGYSNYLLDTLKNKISEIHFESKYK